MLLPWKQLNRSDERVRFVFCSCRCIVLHVVVSCLMLWAGHHASAQLPTGGRCINYMLLGCWLVTGWFWKKLLARHDLPGEYVYIIAMLLCILEQLHSWPVTRNRLNWTLEHSYLALVSGKHAPYWAPYAQTCYFENYFVVARPRLTRVLL